MWPAMCAWGVALLGVRDGVEYAAPQVQPEGAEGGMPKAKLNGTAEEALSQIDAKGYAVSWAADGRTVVKVGVAFDKETRNLGRWLTA